ncbi:MAG TPA: DUF305 domain-containing protein [Pilimelia sp.]|nr:DUF305 domain-containing protein [Pilimelia sp.]
MRHRLPALAAAGALLLGGCGAGDAAPRRPSGEGTATTAPAGTFNDTDVMFLQMMVSHHGEGLEMVRLAGERATRTDVRTLAGAIETSETAEVDTMTAWLRARGEPTTADPNPSMHAGHGATVAGGPARIASLRQAPAADFDHTFLNLLIGHQHNAVELARMELASGANPEVKALAKRIDESRRAQISLMLRYLG